MKQAQQTIGVFDSGVGGISVLKHLTQALPNEDYIYLADSLNAPYGDKSPAFIQQRSLQLSQFLMSKNAKAIVVACNTATAAAVSLLREQFADIPVIAMEPAIKPAVEATKTGVVGVMATSGTLQSAQFAALLDHYGQGVSVVTQACHGLVECVEQAALTQPHTRALLQQYLQPLLDAGADTIVLGCTHYPFLKPTIAELVGQQVSLIDTGQAVAKQLARKLTEADLLSPKQVKGDVIFYSNSQQENVAEVISALWGEPVTVAPLPV